MTHTQIIKNWINSESFKAALEENSLDSRHIDELITDLPTGNKDVLDVSISLYQELVDQYEEMSDDFMAMLVIGLSDVQKIELVDFQQMMSGDLELTPPPELYIVKRELNNLPYIVEEYKRPIAQDIIHTSKGVIYAYFRTMRNDDSELYSPGFYFEHYPKS